MTCLDLSLLHLELRFMINRVKLEHSNAGNLQVVNLKTEDEWKRILFQTMSNMIQNSQVFLDFSKSKIIILVIQLESSGFRYLFKTEAIHWDSVVFFQKTIKCYVCDSFWTSSRSPGGHPHSHLSNSNHWKRDNNFEPQYQNSMNILEIEWLFW